MTGPRHDVVVVGSGPSALASVEAALVRGRRVTVIDAGQRVDSTRAAAASLVRRSSDLTPQAMFEHLAPVPVARDDAPPDKLLLGSDVPYALPPAADPVTYDDVGARASFALGGLSTVWGAAALPYDRREFERWPVSFDELRPHYEAALSLMPIAGRSDVLHELFSPRPRRLGRLPISSSVARLLRRASNRRGHLRRVGVSVGAAQVAVETEGPTGCRQCGFCARGCPYRSIFDAGDRIEQAHRDGRITYLSGRVVHSLEETGGGVALESRPLAGGRSERHVARTVFLATGAMSSTPLLIRTLGVSEPVDLLDSQYFIAPIVVANPTTGRGSDEIFALSQAFVELDDSRLPGRLAHMQIYGPNEVVRGGLEARLGPGRRLPGALALAGRCVLGMQGFLHSDLSGRIRWTRNDDDSISARAHRDDTAVDREVRRVLRVLRKGLWRVGAIPLEPLVDIAAVGRSFHVGGSFPMSRTPGETETDLLGRPAGMSRVHVVDATVLPTVAATTITLTVMANAARIVSAACAP